jgi:hypothetical protein
MLLPICLVTLFGADINPERCAWEIADSDHFVRLCWEAENGERHLIGILPFEGNAEFPGPIFLKPAVMQYEDRAGGIGHGEALLLCCAPLQATFPEDDTLGIMWEPKAKIYLLSLRMVYELDDVAASLRRVQEKFHAGDLFYWPRTRQQIIEAETWPVGVLPFVLHVEERRYVPYALGVNCGRLRIIPASEWDRIHAEGSLTRQDIVLLEEVPADFDARVAGAITCVPQGPLSHVNLICLQESLPNAYVAGAWETFAGLQDKLVKLEVRENRYSLAEAGENEALLLWNAHRPAPLTVAAPDLSFRELPALDEIAGTYQPERFGGKGAALARFLPAIPEGRRVPGFVIPFAYLQDFLDANRLGDLTFSQVLVLFSQDVQFQTDSQYRKQALELFQLAVERQGRVTPEVVERIGGRIRDVFGSDDRKVRFRSSSNAEDSLLFPGAGLYDSYSACAADSLDGDDAGPCRCDALEPEERTIERGLRKVWASLWNFRAYEQRAWYGIQEDRVRMAILVTPAFLTEAANGVALTGSPTDPCDDRHFVTVQLGESSVVRPEPGDVPEVDLIARGGDGSLTVERARLSSLVPFGTFVASESELLELGAILDSLDRSYTPPLPVPKALTRLDVEFKVTEERHIEIKQVRPYLVPGTAKYLEKLAPRAYAFPGTRFINVASGTKDAVTELRARSLVRMRHAAISFPTDPAGATLEWIESVSYAGTAKPLPPLEPAGATIEVDFCRWTNGVATFSWTLVQPISSPDGARLELRSDPYRWPVKVWDLAQESVSGSGLFFSFREGTPVAKYVSIEGSSLPCYHLAAELAEGGKLDLLIRAPSAQAAATDAFLAGARGSMRGRSFFVDDPFCLAVGEGPAPARADYLAVLGFDDLYAVEVEFRTGQVDPLVRILDRELAAQEELPVAAWSRRLFSLAANPRFLRGDVTGDKAINLADALKLLDALFASNGSISCADAADANDDGSLNVSDAIMLLRHVFAGPLLDGACGFDETKDGLALCTYDLWACLGE